METDKPQDETTWNNTHKEDSGQRLNEGFSGENIPGNYDPSAEKKDAQLRTERETDAAGNENEVGRARFVGDNADAASKNSTPDDNSEIRENVRNRDHNYDDASRYKDDPQSHIDRGNATGE